MAIDIGQWHFSGDTWFNPAFDEIRFNGTLNQTDHIVFAVSIGEINDFYNSPVDDRASATAKLIENLEFIANLAIRRYENFEPTHERYLLRFRE